MGCSGRTSIHTAAALERLLGCWEGMVRGRGMDGTTFGPCCCTMHRALSAMGLPMRAWRWHPPALTMASPLQVVMSPSDSTSSPSLGMRYHLALADGILPVCARAAAPLLLLFALRCLPLSPLAPPRGAQMQPLCHDPRLQKGASGAGQLIAGGTNITRAAAPAQTPVRSGAVAAGGARGLAPCQGPHPRTNDQ